MPSTSQVPPRKFDLMTASGLSDEAREAVNTAFDAMSDWRTETAENNERHLTKVIDKMAAAARALGWPEEIVDATRVQMQNIAKMQTLMMDRTMNTWEEQIKAPNPMTGGVSAMLSRLAPCIQLRAYRHSAYTRFEHRLDESVQVLGKCRGAMAKSFSRRDVPLGRES